MKPQVPIEVDETTGVWRTDGLPMLYVPRHFFMNNHLAVEQALGPRALLPSIVYRRRLRFGPHFWCENGSQDARPRRHPPFSSATF